MNTMSVLAGIAFDPTIRGILAVLVGVVVLLGSVYMVLATNVGNRLGFLLSLTAISGWLMLMGLIWWMYGNIGMEGNPAKWQVVDYNRNDLAAATIGPVREINLDELPIYEGHVDYELMNAVRADQPAKLEALAAKRRVEVKDLVFPGITAPEVEQIEKWQEGVDLGGKWEFLTNKISSRGEAETEVAADIVGCTTCDFGIKSSADYVVLDAYRLGGKPRTPDGAGSLERAEYKIRRSLMFSHPTHYAVIQIQKVVPQEAEVGQVPPLPIADKTQPVISVVMVRDLGERRLPPAALTLGSASAFFSLAYMLHKRDKQLMVNQAKAEAAA